MSNARYSAKAGQAKVRRLLTRDKMPLNQSLPLTNSATRKEAQPEPRVPAFWMPIADWLID